MNVFSETELRTYLRLYQQPLAHLDGDENWWRIGPLAIGKTQALFRAGFAAPILPSTRFVLQRFDHDDVNGCAVVLLSGGKPPAYFAGWVPATRADEAHRWVETLNETINNVVLRATFEPKSNFEPVATLVFESGNENAPDDPFGREVIALNGDGRLTYERRRQSTNSAISGKVDSSRFEHLLESLRRTAFPTAPQTQFAPGASIVRITTRPSGESVQVSYFEALRLEGYREIVRELSNLAEALREAKPEVLAAWKFSPA